MRFCLSWFLWLTASPMIAASPAQLDAAIQLFREQKFIEAKNAFEKLAVAEPENSEANYWLGLTAVTLNDAETAVAHLEKATADAPDQARYFHALGNAYGIAAQKSSLFTKLDFAKKCIVAYDKAVALEPDNLEYRKSRYEFYRSAPSLAGGGGDKAATELTEIEKRDPVQGGGLRADLRLKAGHPDEAFAILADLRQRYPDSKVLRYLFGRLAAMTDTQLDEGEAALKEYLLHFPTSAEPPLWSAHWRLAQIHEKKGDLAAAQEEYEATLKANPSFERAREALKKLQ